jgi:hypothetical protein
MPANANKLPLFMRLRNAAQFWKDGHAAPSQFLPSPQMLDDAANEIEFLRDWIQAHGEQTDTCTRRVLGTICGGCECGKLKTSNEKMEFLEMKRDAERYRWLRDGCNEKRSAASRIAADCYGLEWDARIDAAMAEAPAVG